MDIITSRSEASARPGTIMKQEHNKHRQRQRRPILNIT